MDVTSAGRVVFSVEFFRNKKILMQSEVRKAMNEVYEFLKKCGTYYLATKLPCWEVSSLADAERIFAEQFEKLRTTYIDFYLLHSL